MVLVTISCDAFDNGHTYKSVSCGLTLDIKGFYDMGMWNSQAMCTLICTLNYQYGAALSGAVVRK